MKNLFMPKCCSMLISFTTLCNIDFANPQMLWWNNRAPHVIKYYVLTLCVRLRTNNHDYKVKLD